VRITVYTIEADSVDEAREALRLIKRRASVVHVAAPGRIACGTPGTDPNTGRNVRCVCPRHVNERASQNNRNRLRRGRR
jgi:hypothetical protein